MVSSTFYDLRQIRVDLARFISDDLGYIPLLSELPSFPVDPDLGTVENCRARVEKDADLFIVVIGGRYGSIDEKTEKSITNLEFLAARQKGVPIYAFVEKKVLAVMPVWKRNPSGDFSVTVDTPKLFEFVEYVRSQEKVWTFPFDTAQDIIGILRLQLAYLFNDALQVRLRLSGAELPRYFALLGPRALKIALERPPAWEHRLFLQSWIEEVERRTDLVKEYHTGLTIDPAEFVAASDASEWLRTRLHELDGLVASSNRLINYSAQEAFGKPGEPGDPEEIAWVSRMLGVVLDNTLKWAKRIRCARIEAPFDRMGTELAPFVDDLIFQFQHFPRESLKTIEKSLAVATPDAPAKLEMTIVFRISNEEGFHKALNAVRSHYDSLR